MVLFDHTVSFAGTAWTECIGGTGQTVLHAHSWMAHLVELNLAHMYVVLTLQAHYLHSQQLAEDMAQLHVGSFAKAAVL